MNGKKAKALRRIAENATIDHPTVQRTRVVSRPGSPYKIPKYRIENTAHCTRALYQQMKRACP
ncbi:MAG: hypothetical protein HC834_09620 [Rhodospirillales bacterium]|nr:hypothetical protein [Rhodospirillales bacterium]